LIFSFALIDCGGRATRAPSAATHSPAPSSNGPQVALASTSFVIEDCPESKKMDSRAAETAMRKLVEPCGGAKAPSAQFLATLVPGGRIEISVAGKDADEGVVPICVLKNRLTHAVTLKQRCTFSVKLEPSSTVTPAASAQETPQQH
jgi:hypothetical protein